ncbi:unnamed protein product [Rotaria magnacalcarata]|uniref:PDZ domain-containing protein n=1 Tax=Rotaria magnacalcarata TaxID=392030 RepID=A0A816N797_9BILA|nr:unnamed protein product [Rotaria magnacalcarata]
MAGWWCYLVPTIIDLVRAQNAFAGGSFLADPFLELTAGVTSAPNEKSSKSDSSCVSNGALAGSIIGTLILSAFIGFLAWVIYLRQRLQEVQSYKNQEAVASSENHRSIPSISKRQQNKQYTDTLDLTDNQSPIDGAEYKFGTFPFRQSQTPSVLGQYNPADWIHRVPSSFRSETMKKDAQMIDVELLNPTFCGLNFSITGNMRAGIFIKDILDKESAEGEIKLNSSDQLRTGDRIMALTVCFESIVYEDALTILSYASPYPVIIRVQRPLNSTKISVLTEKQLTTINSTTKVKWRDDFDHYDNDTPHNRSIVHQDVSTTIMTDTKSFPTKTYLQSSTKKVRLQPNNNKSSSTTKGNKSKQVSNTVGAATKCSDIGIKKHHDKTSTTLILTSTGLTVKPIDKISTLPTNKSTMQSVTDTVMSYLHYRGANSGLVTDVTNSSESALMPYYDSPYDYYGPPVPHSNLNRNNNNSLSTESLTPVTSIYTLQLSSIKPNNSVQRAIIPRRCQRRFSSPAAILPITVKQADGKNIIIKNIDTFA